MKKLEIEHVAPYLPYGLKIVNGKESDLVTGIDTNRVFSTYRGIYYNTYLLDDITPILRPLSDLTKEIEVNGEKFVPIDKLIDDLGLKMGGLSKFGMHMCIIRYYKNVDYWAIQKLFEWHFDLFGLIDTGLAVDINKI
jgi:hypothetical protein